MMHTDLSNYTVVFSKSSDKFLHMHDEEERQRILEKIRELTTNSENLDIKKLKSEHDLYRLRVGHFRIIYTIKHERTMLYIVAIGLRKDIYQHLDSAA